VVDDLAFKPDELPEDRSLVLVDDDRSFVQRLARAMETRGFEVRTAHSVAEGLELIRQKAPAFAVVDMRLEDGNGLDVIAALSELRPQARTIVLTGYGNIATAVSAVKLGAVDYLAKPADADDVTDALLAPHDEKARPPENPMSADRVRWEHIQRVYELCNRNVSETARRLNMHRRTLQRILAKRAPK
jgi:two-component system, response regulator RegA